MKTKSIIRTGIAVMFILMLSSPVFSQVRFGVKGSVGLNNPDFNTPDETFNVENMTSYSIGPSIEAMIVPIGIADFGIDAALLYNDNRMTITPPPGGEAGTSTEVSNRYLNLPVNAKLKFGLGMLPVRLFATAGPWAGYLIDGDEFRINDITNDIKAQEFQAGANLGFGVEVLRFLQVGLNYSVKLTDNYSIDEPNWKEPLNGKNESWTITGVIYF
ncbi:MAG: outer membrane beta-barrel protein [Fermentimonas sp.]|nr:outer membrane beta-barrel protein [Fermentimonas sp.]